MDIKLRALADFWLRDSNRGIMRPLKTDDEFTLPCLSMEDYRVLATLIFDQRVTIVDERVIPQSAQYRVQVPFEVEVGGEILRGNTGEILRLGQATACLLLGEKKIIPADPNSWHPYMTVFVIPDKKRMFDDSEGGSE